MRSTQYIRLQSTYYRVRHYYYHIIRNISVNISIGLYEQFYSFGRDQKWMACFEFY